MTALWLFELFADDGATVRMEFGTAPAHPNPYLDVPTQLAGSEVDLAEGKAKIGTCNVAVGDKRTVAADQATGRVTALLATAGGESAVLGRRGRLRQSDDGGASWIQVADGPVTALTLNDDYVSYTITLKDENERARRAKAFASSGTAAVFPRGVVGGYGQLPGGGWLLPPVVPVRGTYEASPNTPGAGLVRLDAPPKKLPAHLILTAAMEQAVASEWSETARAFVMPHVSVLWRPEAGGAWSEVAGLRDGRFDYGLPPSFGIRPVDLFVAVGTTYEQSVDGKKVKQEVRRVAGLLLWPVSPQPLPAHGQRVEALVRYTGPASEAYPYHFEGAAWELAKLLYDGLGARYDLAALQAVLSTPIRARITRPIEDDDGVWGFLEAEVYKPLGAAPALDAEGRISPVRYRLPDASVPLTEITDSIAEPVPGWEHSVQQAVNVVRVTYKREYRVPADADPLGERSQGDGLADVEQEIEVRPDSVGGSASLALLGERELRIQAGVFRAIGGTVGEPVSGDVTTETGYLLASERGRQALDRLLFGAQTAAAVCRRSATAHLRVGDWVLLGLSWMPDYQTGKRGINALAQIVSIQDLDPAAREMTFVTAGPAAQPVAQPSLGALSADAEGVVSVPVTSVPAGGAALLEYAISAAEPAPAAGLWTPLGRAAEPATLRTPPQPAGATVWVRAQGVAVGRRSSARTVPISIVLPQTPRVEAVRLAIAEDGTPTVLWTPNAYAAGVRIRFEVHDPAVEPTLASSIDRAAVAGSAALPSTVLPGQRCTAEVEPWTGWDGATAFGTAGPLVRAVDGEEPDLTGPQGADGDALSPQPPQAWIAVSAETLDPAAEALGLFGLLGTGVTGALNWHYRIDSAGEGGTWTPFSTDPLPQQIIVQRSFRHSRTVVLEVIDGLGQSAVDTYTLEAIYPGLGGGGRVRPDEPMEDGTGIFRKPTPLDQDHLGSVPDGGGYRRPRDLDVNTNGRVRQVYDETAATGYTGEYLGEGADRAVGGLDADGRVKLDVPAPRIKYTDGTQFDQLKPAEAGAQVTNGKSLTVLTDRNLDNIGDSVTYRRPGAAYVDANARVSGVYDPNVGIRDGAQIGSGVSRANSGLNSTGDVQRAVPMIHAVSNIPALANGDGRIDRTQAFSGSTELPESTLGAQTKSVVSSRELAFVPHLMWDFRGVLEGFTTANIFVEHDTNFVRLRSTTNDPNFLSPYVSFSGARFPIVRIRMKRLEGSGWDGPLFYETSSRGFSGSFYGVMPPTLAGNSLTHPWQIIEVDMTKQAESMVGGSDWINSTIARLRFDFGNTGLDVFDVDWIAVGSYSPNVGDLRPYTSGGTLRDRVGLVGQQTVQITKSNITSNYNLSTELYDINVASGTYTNGPVQFNVPNTWFYNMNPNTTYYFYYDSNTGGVGWSGNKSVAMDWNRLYLGYVTTGSVSGGGGDGGGGTALQ